MKRVGHTSAIGVRVSVVAPHSCAGELGTVTEITPRPGHGVWVRLDNGGAWLLYEDEMEDIE